MPIILSAIDLPTIMPPIRPSLFAEPGERVEELGESPVAKAIKTIAAVQAMDEYARSRLAHWRDFTSVLLEK